MGNKLGKRTSKDAESRNPESAPDWRESGAGQCVLPAQNLGTLQTVKEMGQKREGRH